jgi:hypothetical protein
MHEGGVAAANCRGHPSCHRGVPLAADLTPKYSEQDLRRYDDLIAAIRDRVALLQAFIDQLTGLDELQEAWSALDEMTETIALFETERRRILEALTK